MDNIDAFSQKYDRATLTDIVASTDSIFFETKKTVVQKVLRKKLIAVKQEKQTLEEVIVAKNNEIDDLKKCIGSLNDVINSVPIEDLKNNSNIASAKITELCKKNKLLRTDMDSLKNKNIKLESKVQNLEVDLKKAAEKKKELIAPKKAESSNEDLQLKLQLTKQKLFDSLNQNVELKNHLKLAQKCIQQEIGEHVNLNILAASGTNWRGRAQQIMGLQLKINELKEQLDGVKSVSNWSSASYYTDEAPIRREHIHHRAEVDILQKDIKDLSSQIEELNQKIAALKSRNTNLVADIARQKEKCSILESVAESNNSAMELLREKLDVQKFNYENRINDLQKQLTDTQKNHSDFEFQREEMSIKLENLQEEINNREDHIEDLNGTIKKLNRDLKSICGDFLYECREFRKEEFLGLLNSLETEKINLLNINKTINERLDAERSIVLNLTDQLSKQKIKICRLEGRLRDFEKCQDTQMEKKKRSQRISEYANNINTTCSVTSFVFENKSFADIVPTYGPDDEALSLQTTDLQNKLEVAYEKITLLEDKLNHLNEEKLHDAQTFENTIKMSKTTLLNTIHQVKADTLLELK